MAFDRHRHSQPDRSDAGSGCDGSPPQPDRQRSWSERLSVFGEGRGTLSRLLQRINKLLPNRGRDEMAAGNAVEEGKQERIRIIKWKMTVRKEWKGR